MKIEKLYDKYKSKSIYEIQTYLNRIQVVREKDGKYYSLSEENLSKMFDKPRNISLTFDTDLQNEPLELIELKTIKYLVKSSSRFFLKPDIGEVFDQCDELDLRKISAICVDIDNHVLIDGTDGEHFIMEAKLMGGVKIIRKKKLEQIKNVL